MVGILVVNVLAFGMGNVDSDGIVGKWLSQKKDAHIEIEKAANGTYEGRIVWLAEPNYPVDDQEANKPKHDRHNPDVAKQQQPIVGLRILEGFSYDSDGVWKGGTVYDPETGKTYKCKLTLKNGTGLEVRGYIGTPMLGRTEQWSRLAEDKK